MKRAASSLLWQRAVSSAWRFRTFQRAERLFSRLEAPCVLARPYCGYQLSLDVTRSTAHRLLYLEGERFVAERSIFRSLLKPGMRVVDVGANVGYYALMIARGVGPDGSLLAIEPEPANLEELTRNVRLNGIENATILPLACGRADGTARLRPGMNGRIELGAGQGSEVTIRSLDSVLDRPVDLIKVDVEGFEGEVLAGAERILREQRPDLFVEVHPSFLSPPTTFSGLFAALDGYSQIRLFAPSSQATLLSKIIARYKPGGDVRRIGNIAGWVKSCERGEVREPFWVVARALPGGPLPWAP